MSTRVANEYREIKRKDGSTMRVKVERIAKVKLGVSTRLRRRKSGPVTDTFELFGGEAA